MCLRLKSNQLARRSNHSAIERVNDLLLKLIVYISTQLSINTCDNIIPICELITELDFITDFDLITKFWRIPLNIATGAASQQRTFTPPDTWSCPIWDLHLF